jgi:hypothetical protein
MPLQLWLPIDERPRFLCNICGSMLLSQRSYEWHVAGCARDHEAELERYRSLNRDNVLHESADPEYRKWQKDNPIGAEKEIRKLGGTP